MTNYNIERNAKSCAFDDVGETCPAVDDALETASNVIKEQTSALRDALIAAHVQRLTLENEVEELQKALDTANSTIESLESDITFRDQRIDELQSELEEASHDTR